MQTVTPRVAPTRLTMMMCTVSVEDLEMNDGSAEKPYYMSKGLMGILGKKNKEDKEKEEGEGQA